MKITGRQLRMARVAMKWRVDDLSKKCGVPWARLQLFERSDEFIEESEKTEKIINTFLSNNIEFKEGDSNYSPYIKIKK
tara:strand:- start:469 stop:705 length:237 start_codon:yes stop_codon:yes gene_type:complete